MNDFFHSHWFDWDKQFFQFLNGHHTPFWDKVLWVFSSNTFGAVFGLLLVAAVIWLYRKQSWRILLFIMVTMAVADTLGARVLKPTVKRLRPSHDFEYHEGYEVQLHQYADGTFYYGGRYSWPSNHAINYLTASILFFYFLQSKVKRRGLLAFLLFGITFASCYSRVYVGVHYPFDIFCGWLLAAFLAGLAIMILRSFAARKPKTVSRTSSDSNS